MRSAAGRAKYGVGGSVGGSVGVRWICLTVPNKQKTEIMPLWSLGAPTQSLSIHAAAQRRAQMERFVYRGGATSADADMPTEVKS